MIRRWLALLSLASAPLWANEPAPELKLLSEHPVMGMSGGNLSGIAWCGDALWAVSDREDDVLYRLDTSVSPWQAQKPALRRIAVCLGACACAPGSVATYAVVTWISKG